MHATHARRAMCLQRPCARVRVMNYLAHTLLVRGNEGLMLGGLFGDHVRGLRALRQFPPDVGSGIRLHRYIDRTTDSNAQVKALLRHFPRPFRRYAGIIVDVAFDHELARSWSRYGTGSLEDFDLQIRQLLARNKELVPEGLAQFMKYADRRGLFAAYRNESELLISLAGVGRRLSRANPLDRVDEIWPSVREPCATTFAEVFPQIQADVNGWIKRKMGSV